MTSYQEREEPKVSLVHFLSMAGIIAFCLGSWALIIWAGMGFWELLSPHVYTIIRLAA